jgi:hypothetical protein
MASAQRGGNDDDPNMFLGERQPRDATSWGARSLMAYNEHRLAQFYFDSAQYQLSLQMANEAHALYKRLRYIRELSEGEERRRRMPDGFIQGGK